MPPRPTTSSESDSSPVVVPEASSAQPGPAVRRGRPRQAQVDARLELAVLELLRAGGPGAVTMEAVGEASGVAKTTIYRRYANRSELLTSVLSKAAGSPEALPEGAVREKIGFALNEAWRQMADVLGPGGLAAIVTNADPEFTDLFRAALRPFDEALVARIEADSESGLLRAGVDADGAVSLFLGAYVGELVRRGEVGEDWMERCLEMMWFVLAAPEL